jgi:cytochrome c peroxidase
MIKAGINLLLRPVRSGNSSAEQNANCLKLMNPALTLTVAATLCLVSTSAVSAADAPKPAELRAKAKDILGPLPDRMPGGAADTPALVALGQKLYFEKKLSVNNSQSCNSCHRVDEGRGGVDNEPTSEGAFKKRGDRNSPTTLNAGFHFAQFWDGRASNLVAQAKGPILNPVEMAMPDEAEVLKRLKADRAYPPLFDKAFPGTANPITYENVAQAIAAFERTLITHDRLDDFQNGADRALSEPELRGLDLFLTAGCTTCHFSPALGGTSYQKVGLVHPYETPDLGRAKITKDEDDNYKFKVPSLRNVALTAPYFHDGKQATLRETVIKMAYIQLDRKLTDAEADSLVAFLNSLTDKPRVKK